MSRILVVFILSGIKVEDVFVFISGLSCGDGACLDILRAGDGAACLVILLAAGLLSSW